MDVRVTRTENNYLKYCINYRRIEQKKAAHRTRGQDRETGKTDHLEYPVKSIPLRLSFKLNERVDGENLYFLADTLSS